MSDKQRPYYDKTKAVQSTVAGKTAEAMIDILKGAGSVVTFGAGKVVDPKNWRQATKLFGLFGDDE